MDPYREALQRARDLISRARKAGVEEPTAMVLATADARGHPSTRVVLLKDLDDRGFVFYTNLESRKGRQLAENPRAAVTIFVQPLREQANAEGRIERVTDGEADAYWLTRPHESQVGAWASDQSRPLESRDELMVRFEDLLEEYEGREVARPQHWSGYRLVPERIELWVGKEHRLHDRTLYEKRQGIWTRTLLYP